MVISYHTLRIDFDPSKFEEINLPNGLIIAVDSDHARDNCTRRSCHNIITLTSNVGIDWKVEQHKYIALHSTDSETRGAFATTKKGLSLQDVAEFLGFNGNDFCLLPIYKDSQPCIDILQAKTVTSYVKHITVPIHFIHDQIFLERIVIQKIGTNLNLADSGTKPNSSPVHFYQHDHIIGVQFYSPKGSAHAQLLQIDFFAYSPHSNTKVHPNTGPDLEEIE